VIILKITSIGADISSNDVFCSQELVKNVENDVSQLINMGADKAAVTNVTGDDLVISAFVQDNNLNKVNRAIVDILLKNAEDLGDLDGISDTPDDAGEGISYAEAKIRQDRFPDAIIMAFDTYGGEKFVHNVAESVKKAAYGMDGVTDLGGGGVDNVNKIPGVGYVSDMTDDPVIAVTIEDLESIGVVAGAMTGAALGHKNVYLVRRGSPSYIIPGSVIISVSAYMNGNVMDLAVPLSERMEILKV
jgi:hypothetical protein